MEDNQYKAIFDNNLDGIVIFGKEGEIKSINAACAQLFRYETNELIGQKFDILFPAAKREIKEKQQENYFFAALKLTLGRERELNGLRKDNTLFPLAIRVSEMPDSNVVEYLAVFHDLSQLRRTESALWEAESRISSIFRTAVDCIVNIDRRGIIEKVNPAGAKMFGYLEQELIGRNVNILMPEPYHSGHDGYLENYLRTGETKIIGIGREVTARRKDGEIFPIYLSVSMTEQEGRVIFTGIIHDITKQKNYEQELKSTAIELEKAKQFLEKRVTERTEELEKVVNDLEKANLGLKLTGKELNKALEKAQELSDLKSKFVTLASHEFRTPLATILSSAALISKYDKAEDSENRARHIGRIKNTVGALNSILNEFLSYSKIEEGKVQFTPVNFNFQEFCEELIEEMGTVTKTGQEIKCIFTQGNESIVTQDRQILKNILVNLISNAIKYSAEGKLIILNCTAQNECLEIIVKDQGIGIPPEDQKHLFERFFRAHNATHIQGTGLGLNIVKRYAEFLGGTIKFSSKFGEGSIFTITIPYSRSV